MSYGAFLFANVQRDVFTAGPFWGYIWGYKSGFFQYPKKYPQMPLTKLECDRAACPAGRPYARFTDEKGIYLEVKGTGGKYWRMKYRYSGKEKLLALGAYPAVSLAQAREARELARKTLAAGNDPAQLKQDAKLIRAMNDVNTFEAVARQWWEHWNGTKTPRHSEYVLRRLEADVFPALGTRPVASITAPSFWRWPKASKHAARWTLPSAHCRPAGRSCGMPWPMA